MNVQKPAETREEASRKTLAVLHSLYSGWTEEKLRQYLSDVAAGTAPRGIIAMCERYGLIHFTPEAPIAPPRSVFPRPG